MSLKSDGKVVIQTLVNLALVAIVAVALTAAPALAQTESPVPAQQRADTLDQLLRMVKDRTLEDRSELKKREAEFAAASEKQAELLKQAKAKRDAVEARGRALEKAFDDKKQLIKVKEQELTNKLGSIKELFGIFQQTAGDLQGIFHNSPTSAQYPDRGAFLEAFARKMSRASQISTIEEIEQLWYELQREMTESGKIVRFSAPVLTADGAEQTKEVIRVGTFNVISHSSAAKYLVWRGETQRLAELKRQPLDRFLDLADDYAEAGQAPAAFGLDPTGGSLLARLVETPGVGERIEQGGLVGYVILALGLVALVIAGERLLMLSIIGYRIRLQRRSLGRPDRGNPLGRVLLAYHGNRGVDAETLEMKLGEAILKELPNINRALLLLKIIAVVAPLLGLLGTVTGMINTFQAITLFGTGDPKTMAGGISQALVTTVLGLSVAIPVVFLHTLASTRAKAISHLLQEQSAGLIAEYMETRGRAAAPAPQPA